MKAAENGMITGEVPLFDALHVICSAQNVGRLARVCCKCGPPDLKEWVELMELENVSHGYCDACLAAELAEHEAGKVVAA